MSTKAQAWILLGALGLLAVLVGGRLGFPGDPRTPDPAQGSGAVVPARDTPLVEALAASPVEPPGEVRSVESEQVRVEPLVAEELADETAGREALRASAGKRVLEWDIREARQVILRLEEELEKNLKERLALEEQVRRLTHSLAEEKAHADRLRIRVKPTEPGLGSEPPALAGVMERTVRVVEVDLNRRVAILDAGRANGIRPGMVFGVLRNGVPVSRLRATDVRNQVTAAEIEDVREGQFPQAGDQAVPWTGGVE